MFVPGGAGEWDTGSSTFGVVRGRGAISELVKGKLPPPPAVETGMRHSFVDPANGLDVVMPNGDVCTFSVELDDQSGLIRRLVRIPAVSGGGHEATHA